MNSCEAKWKAYVVALAAWMLRPLGEGEPPSLTEYDFCRSCALGIFSRVAELSAVYSDDVLAVISVTQDELELVTKSPAPLKH